MPASIWPRRSVATYSLGLEPHQWEEALDPSDYRCLNFRYVVIQDLDLRDQDHVWFLSPWDIPILGSTCTV